MDIHFRRKEILLRHSDSRKLMLCSIIMLMNVSRTSNTAVVSLKLIRYDNPTHYELKGGCCEWICWEFLQLGVCDNRFSMCIDEIESLSDSMNSCSYLKMKDFHEDDDEFCFPATFSSNHLNPINFEVPNYKGCFRFKCDIWDEDWFNPDDHIDFYNEEICIAASPSADSTRTVHQTLYGHGYSRTTIAVQVYCATGYYGNNCSVYCVASDNYDEGHYTCDPSTGDKICMPGYEGELCKIDIDECESSPCQNGGTCTDYVNYFTCECSEGTTGERCETILDKCDSNPCKNDATCVDAITSFSCTCPAGFEGEFCETETDECHSNPCQNSGTCLDMIDMFQCNCPAGYYGLLCETDHDDCACIPCSNGATCTYVLDGYKCTCAPGFFGVHCKGSVILVIGISITALILAMIGLFAWCFCRTHCHQRSYERLEVLKL